jgi:pyruvate, water dikinase
MDKLCMNVLEFSNCSYQTKHLVGGKSSSLGELYNLAKHGDFQIADGFSTTTVLFDRYIQDNGLTDLLRQSIPADITVNLAKLTDISNQIKNKILTGSFTKPQINDITKAYVKLCNNYQDPDLAVAIRSSSISEDSQNASFAGQQDSFLNVSGIDNVLLYIKHCIASLYNVRAISYRTSHNIPDSEIKIAVAVQKMIRSDLGSAGVGFSLDPETGYDKAVVINSAFGLGELVVSGGVTPDEIVCNKSTLRVSHDPILSKKKGDKTSKIVYDNGGGTITVDTTVNELNSFSITDAQAIQLAQYILELEDNYVKLFGKKTAVDIEWAIDGIDHQIYILQTRPETVHSLQNSSLLSSYILDEPGESLLTGIAVGDKISSGKIKILQSFSEAEQFQPGDILVTDMTTPDWEPIMKISSGIITNRGGRTCHASIVAREMGLNAVVGTHNGTNILHDISEATIYCAGGETGTVYRNQLNYHVDQVEVSQTKQLPVKLMMNVGNPESCFQSSMLPHSGVGLVRIEFIISNYIKIHPRALIDYPNISESLRSDIDQRIGKTDPVQHYITELSRGIAKIAAAYAPHEVIVRFSDFKSNEYRNLVGGNQYEPEEENPMIGWRGASRYYSSEFQEAFRLECQAIQYVRNTMKLTNVIVMIPFCRTVKECEQVLETMAKFGLVRGEDGLQVYLMCEIPSNVIEAPEFSRLVDGVSIGGNDLLQLSLGVDRDSDRVAHLTDDQNLSYRRLIQMAIKTYQENGVKVGFCGQQPSDSVEFSQFLIKCGIDSISVTPDSVLQTIHNLVEDGQ